MRGKYSLIIGLVVALIASAAVATQSRSELNCYNAPDTCYVCRDWVSGEIIELDLGACDSVQFGCPIEVLVDTMQAGDSITIPVFLWNDYPLGGFSLGFRHDGTGVKFGGNWRPALRSEGGIFTEAQAEEILYAVPACAKQSGDCNSAMIGWVDMSGIRPVPANTSGRATLLGDMYLKLIAPSSQVVTIDSAFYPPAGYFWLVSNYSIRPVKSAPNFQPCSGITITGSLIDCGDVNGDGVVNLADIVYLLYYLFANGSAPVTPEAGDVNCDGRMNIGDVMYMVNYVFRGGFAPCMMCD